MASICHKLCQQIKNFDLFGIPVQLTYRGETKFNTVFGGCVSMMLVVVLGVGFVYQLHSLYYNPEFMSYPATYDFRAKTS